MFFFFCLLHCVYLVFFLLLVYRVFFILLLFSIACCLLSMYCHRFQIISLEGVWEITTGMSQSLQTSLCQYRLSTWNGILAQIPGCHPIRHKEFSHTSINEAHMHGSGPCPAGRHRNTSMHMLCASVGKLDMRMGKLLHSLKTISIMCSEPRNKSGAGSHVFSNTGKEEPADDKDPKPFSPTIDASSAAFS